MARERIDVKKAAQILGISTDAVHKRAKRGTLPSDKDPDGRVFVYLDNDLDGDYTRPDNGYTPDGHGSHESVVQHGELVDELRSRVRFLEAELESRKEEGRRKDHLLAAALERIPAIEPPETPQAPETATETSGSGDVPTEPEKRFWWRRFFGF